jgi:LmbE family N-acetylglucosaminyl deacetylase
MSVILVVAAHPDDEVLGCGGTIAKLSAENDTYTLILGEGVTSRKKSVGKQDAELKSLKKDIISANKILGTKKVFIKDLPDNKFDTVPLLDIIKIIETLMSVLKPEYVFTHHYGDLNIDHRIVYDAVLTACRPVEQCPVKKLVSFEVPSSTEWNSHSLINGFHPTIFENIDKTLDQKISAMSAYQNEIRSNPHPRSLEKIRALAQVRGAAAGMNFAEAFMLVREFND